MEENETRRLLELAAKAAGLTVYQWSDEFRCLVAPAGMAEDGEFSAAVFTWAPHLDDGDALQLAVLLGTSLHLHNSEVVAEIITGEMICEQWGEDPYAATRLAIVRAAAAIGEAIP